METKTKRTLVKSAPELWELADDLARMEAWMAGLVGASEPIPVEITDRQPERILAAYREVMSGGGRPGRIPPLWDGGASARIVARLREAL